MRRLTNTEKKAAMVVIGMAAAAAGAGVSLLRKHARYVAMKAAAFFEGKDGGSTGEETGIETGEESGEKTGENTEK